MRSESARQGLERAAFIVLCALLLVLPSIEAPKTALWLVLLVVSVAMYAWSPSPSRRFDAVEWSLLAVAGASLLSTAANWPTANRLKGLTDTVMYTTACWCVYRARWTDTRRSIFALMITIGVLAGLLRGLWDVYQGYTPAFKFHSAGVVTQSSMYLGIALVMVGGLLMGRVGPGGKPWGWDRVFWGAALFAMVVSLAFMASRGAILAVVLTWSLVLLLRRRVRAVFVTTMVIAGVVTVLYAAPDWFNQSRFTAKINQWLTTFRLDGNDSFRMAHWQIAMEAVSRGDTLIFGVGPRNFSSIDVPGLRDKWPGQRFHHAHNLFLNKLVEEGIIGLAAFLTFLALAVRRLVSDPSFPRAVGWTWIAAFGALMVPTIAGSFNTPWYQEHAMLAMLLIGFHLAPNRSREALSLDRVERPVEDPVMSSPGILDEPRFVKTP